MSIRPAFVAIVLVLAAAPAAGKPCTCEDIADLRKSLVSTKQTRTAYYSVLTDIVSHSPNAPADVEATKLSFQKKMGWTSVVQVGGVTPEGDIILDQGYKNAHCDTVIEGVKTHETAHKWYFRWHVYSVAAATERWLARIVVESEIDARNAQARFLTNEIKKLKKQCGRDYSSSGPESGPESGRIQDVVD